MRADGLSVPWRRSIADMFLDIKSLYVKI